MYKNIYLKDQEETLKIGESIGTILKPGSFICLYGDLGAGKTHMAKGIAKGLGIKEVISSPTFTIVQEYDGEKAKLIHFDVYRLADSEELEFIGFYDYMKQSAIILMEWAERVSDLIPDSRVDIRLYYSEDGGRLMDVDVMDANLIESFKALALRR